jgi:hypothetical protein
MVKVIPQRHVLAVFSSNACKRIIPFELRQAVFLAFSIDKDVDLLLRQISFVIILT